MRYRLFAWVFLAFLGMVTAPMVTGQENNIAIGTWRVHLPYNNMRTAAIAGTKVYAASGSSVFYFDKEESTVTTLSKYSGLNDVSVSKLGYSTSQNVLLLGYETGNIDIINGNEIFNANDIVRFNSIQSKKINHFYFNNEFVYISGDFGVTLYNLKKREVKESYLTLASNAATNEVYAATLTSDKDSIFLATSKGVMAAKVSQAVNLLDFSNWHTFQTTDGIDTVNVTAVCARNGLIYASVRGKGIYYYNGSGWVLTSVPITGGEIRSLTSTANGVLACVDSAVYKIDSPSSWSEIYLDDNASPTEALYDSENTLWISALGGGLVRGINSSFNYIVPNGPYTSDAFSFGYYNNNFIVLSGGYNVLGQKTYFGNWYSIFENNVSWKPGYVKFPSIPNTFRDFISATYNSKNNTLYLSSYGDGLIAIPNDQVGTIYTDTNSPLKKDGAGMNVNVLVGETCVDSDGYLWVPNRSVSTGQPNIHKLSPDGNWTSYVIGSSIAKNITSVTIDDYDNKWLRSYTFGTDGGIVIFNEKKNLTRTLTKINGEGKLPDSKINCIVKDKKGTIYIGTDKGIAVCYDPYNILNAGVDLVTPIYDGFPILYERNVLSIEVDGGNRKWVGTNDGLWLFNEDLTKVLLYFTTENSPLLSDYISSIKIHPISGEVFFATPLGVIAYRGTATEGEENYADVKVFPNPVKPDFNGLVGISGLVADVTVKITDVGGNLVYETKAQGGTATWNVKDYNGRRAATGVYLIFCSAADGSSKFVSKIAVVE